MVLTCFVYLWFPLRRDWAFQLFSCFTDTSLIIWESLELDVSLWCQGRVVVVDIGKISLALQCWNVGQYCINWNCLEQRLSKITVIPTLMSQTPGKLYISKTELSTESSVHQKWNWNRNYSFNRVSRMLSKHIKTFCFMQRLSLPLLTTVGGMFEALRVIKNIVASLR